MASPIAVLSSALTEAEATTAVQLFEEREINKLALMINEIHSITDAWTEAVPQTAEQAAALSELLARGSIALKELEAAREVRTRPLVAEQRTINGLFHRITDPLEMLLKKGKRAFAAYQEAERARVQREEAERLRRMEEAAKREREALERAEAAKTEAARKKALAQAEAASREQAQATAAVPEPATKGVRTDSGTSYATGRWTFSVLKPELVPRQYLAVDEKAIRAAVNSGIREILGVAIFREESVGFRTGEGRAMIR